MPDSANNLPDSLSKMPDFQFQLHNCTKMGVLSIRESPQIPKKNLMGFQASQLEVNRRISRSNESSRWLADCQRKASLFSLNKKQQS